MAASPWAEPVIPKMSPGQPSSSAPMTPAMSPARSSSSTAGFPQPFRRLRRVHRTQETAMTSHLKIRSIHAAPLLGESPKGGWSSEIKPEDSIHAIIAVHTDAGITGYGSVFTDGRLAQAGVEGLEPLWRAETALEPERLTEKLHQNTFWMGRGGTLTHVISGIDIALWDIFGKATGQPVARLLGGTYRDRVKPYCSLLMEEPAQMKDVVAAYR